MQCLPCYPPLQRRPQKKRCEGGGAGLRTSLRACHGVHTRDRHLSVGMSEALVKTTRVTPQRIPRLRVPGRSAHAMTHEPERQYELQIDRHPYSTLVHSCQATMLIGEALTLGHGVKGLRSSGRSP